MRGKVFTRLGGWLGVVGVAACTVGGGGEVEEQDWVSRFRHQREGMASRGGLASEGESHGPKTVESWVHRYVVLEGPAVAEVRKEVGENRESWVAQGRARLREIDAQQEALLPRIEATGARVVYRFRRLANAIQITAPVEALGALGRLPGVVRLDTVTIHERGLKSAVPFVGGYKAWSAQGG
ncbi:MAG: hypothetical protein RMJ98_04140, partial [Myxococcales bacterium]|nr:hypothetical protein [Polyangiaceae bacterium]MDW8248480.1 hypothetical protein [Myxococcales bacterium]